MTLSFGTAAVADVMHLDVVPSAIVRVEESMRKRRRRWPKTAAGRLHWQATSTPRVDIG